MNITANTIKCILHMFVENINVQGYKESAKDFLEAFETRFHDVSGMMNWEEYKLLKGLLENEND